VAWLLLVLVALAVVAPYLWLQHGPASYVAGNALVLMGAAVLVVWTASEWALWAKAHPRPWLSIRAGKAPARRSVTHNRCQEMASGQDS
jgi:hypothetical protein